MATTQTPTSSPPAKKAPAKRAPAKKTPASKPTTSAGSKAKKGVVSKAAGATPAGRAAKLATRAAGGAKKVRDTGRKVSTVRRETRETARNFGLRSGPSYKAAHKTLVYEMVLAEVILGLNWFFTPKQDGPAGSTVFGKATGIAMLYMVLALISDAGLIGARFSAGLGMVVVLGVVLNSAGLLTLLSNFTGNSGNPGSAGPEPTVPGATEGSEGNGAGPKTPPKTPREQ